MSIINDSNKLGSGGQNLVLETAGKVYVKVKDRFYELDFRNQGKGGTTVINNTVQEDVPETDLSEYVTKDDLDASLRNYVTKRSWNDVKETQEMLEQALLDGFTERINPISIDTMQLIVGSKQLQFEFIESLIDGTPKAHGVYIDEIGRLVCPEGVIQHYTIDGPDAVQPEKALKQYCRWTVKSNSNTDPDNKDAYFDLPVDDQAYYLYIVADKINFTQEAIDLPDDEASKTGIYAKTGEATFLISETAYGLHAEGDNSKYYFLYAIVNSKSDGVRSISTLNGFTEILPGQITAYVFKNPTGTSYIDLLGNKMNFGGKLTYNVDHPDALVIHGAIIQDDGGNESLITVDRGVYSNDNCYYEGDLVQWTDADDNKSTYYHFVDSETCGIDPSDETVWRIYAQGSTGDTMFKSVVFKRTNSTPATPEGGSFDSPLPEPRNGWEDGVPEGEAQLWMSTRVFSKSGKRDGNWTTPQPATDTADLDFEYSSNALDNKPINPDDDTTGAWHDHAVPEDNWMAMRKINNGEPVLIPASTKGWEINQIKGESGKDAKLLYLSASSLVFTYDTKESTSPRESSIVFTCKTQNVTSTSYSWSYKKQGSSSYTRITGVSGSTFTLNASSISTYFGSGQYCTFKVEIDGLSDEIAIALIYGGTDAITTFLTNTSHVFEGDEDSAIAGTDHINVLVYKGIELLSSSKYTLGTITGQQTGLTTSTTTATESGVTVRSITITVTTSLTKSGVLTIPVNVESSTIDLKYSWSISFKGKPGESKQGATARVREWKLNETYYNGEIADEEGKYWMDFVYYNGNYYRCTRQSVKPTSGIPTSWGFVLESKYSFIASKVLFVGNGSDGWVLDEGEIYHTGNKAKLTRNGDIYLGGSGANANFKVSGNTGTVTLKGNIELETGNSIIMGTDLDTQSPNIKLKISSEEVELYPKTVQLYSNNNINLSTSASATYRYTNRTWVLQSGTSHGSNSRNLSNVYLTAGSKIQITINWEGTQRQPWQEQPEDVSSTASVYLHHGTYGDVRNNGIVPASGWYDIKASVDVYCYADDGGWEPTEGSMCYPSGDCTLYSATIIETIYNAEDKRIIMGTNGINIMLGNGTYVQATDSDSSGNPYPEICLRTKDWDNTSNPDGWYIKIGRNGIRVKNKGDYNERLL